MIVERGCFCYSIVNDIRNFVFGLAGATVYGFCKSREQKFVMSFTIIRESKAGDDMLALEGYYDGENVQTLGKIHAQKNQKLIITILDEFVEELPKKKSAQTVRGMLAKYADPNLRDQEESAWEKAVLEKYGNA